MSGWPPLDLETILIFLSAENIIANIIIWTDSLHESSGKLSLLSNKTRMRSFGLLELEIWAKYWTMSGLQDRFWLLCCCYNLSLKTVLLNLGLFMKVLGLCLSFLSIYTRPKSKFCSSIYDQMVFQFQFNQHLFSKLSPLFVFSISVVKLINQSFDLCDRPAFKMNIYH